MNFKHINPSYTHRVVQVKKGGEIEIICAGTYKECFEKVLKFNNPRRTIKYHLALNI